MGIDHCVYLAASPLRASLLQAGYGGVGYSPCISTRSWYPRVYFDIQLQRLLNTPHTVYQPPASIPWYYFFTRQPIRVVNFELFISVLSAQWYGGRVSRDAAGGEGVKGCWGSWVCTKTVGYYGEHQCLGDKANMGLLNIFSNWRILVCRWGGGYISSLSVMNDNESNIVILDNSGEILCLPLPPKYCLCLFQITYFPSLNHEGSDLILLWRSVTLTCLTFHTLMYPFSV